MVRVRGAGGAQAVRRARRRSGEKARRSFFMGSFFWGKQGDGEMGRWVNRYIGKQVYR
jgi:hypothetical protein